MTIFLLASLLQAAHQIVAPRGEQRWHQNCLYYPDVPEVLEALRGKPANMCEREFWDI